MIKAAFFDIDGTLLSFETHKMPESTKRALTELRRRGILTIICSGRPTYQLAPCVASGFDAYVTLNGQLCYDEQGVYRDVPIAPDGVRAVFDQAGNGLYDVLVLQGKRAFCNTLTERIKKVASMAGLTYEVDDLEHALKAPVYQFCAFIDPTDEHLIAENAPGVITTRWTDLFCDVVPAVGGKDYGVRATLERYGLTPDQAIAFGDGGNDLPMFAEVGTSVAMGNAWESVREQADYVTASVDDDGIWKACEHYGLV